ncbi:hypothetical protein [Lacimicrobium alkaliphilum]|uniref:DUF2273 domain-containing protein n=1 Tax=Lacimicrobium alkaliphilum TaxID=1526571 RepID=A0ABQ1R9F5_9ALTE|nr:hypothetical protein [Lacimicrobium alkaliphilum]GGD62877.1 hypothetical protein GCM10011357_17700 [Lacimicrobium alkaliphilum]
MTIMRSIGLLLGLLLVAAYGHSLYTKYYSFFACLAGMVIGFLFIFYGIKGKDLVEVLYQKLTGRSFSNGN